MDDRGDPAENLELFHRLVADKEDIETEIGEALSWEELAGKRACRIALYREGSVENEDQHEEYIAWLVETLQRFRTTFTHERLSGADA